MIDLNAANVETDARPETFLQALTPAALEATQLAIRQRDPRRSAQSMRLAVERARYEAERAERRYRA